ncbi:MAG TPA: LysM peptidoglycan-binding domain-containing protein [Bacteroidia bacterium]
MISVPNLRQPLNGSKQLTIRSTYSLFLLGTLYFILCTSFLFSQPQQKPEIRKTKSSAIIDGKKYYLHTVEKGQTLYAISKVYDVTVSEILSENPDAVDGIKPGQVLRVPFNEKKKKKDDNDTGEYYYHKVTQGETVFSISQKLGVTEDVIMKNNPGLDKANLKPGQLVKIPGTPREIVEEKKDDSPVVNTPDKKDLPPVQLNSNENNFNVALFLPFYLSYTPYIETEKIKKGLADFPKDSRIAVEFYQGAMMALDSLKRSGISVKLYVYDTGTDSSGSFDVNRFPELKKMDLIIGPLYTSHFVALSKFAKENNIPIVSPLSQNNKILLGNVNVSKATPSVMTQVEQSAAYIGKKWFDQNILLMNSLGPKDISYNNTVKQLVNTSKKDHHLEDSVITVTTLKNITDNLKNDKVNVIVIMNSTPAFVTDILSKLSKMKDDTRGRDSIIVFGMSSWMGIESIDMEYLSNLNVFLPVNNFTAYDDANVAHFIHRYRASHNTEPSEYVYQGFDVMYYYVSAMKAVGAKSMQQELPNRKWKGTHLNFDLYQSSPESGYENRAVFILRYDHDQLVKME